MVESQLPLRSIPRRLLLLLLLSLLSTLSEATERFVYWNSSNPIFKTTGENSLSVQLKDQVTFVCPSDGIEVYKIYWSSSWAQSQNCSGGTLLFNCRRMSSYLVTVHIFSADPTAPGFNNPVYFYSPSNGSLLGLEQTAGGACRSRNMRLTLRTADSSSTLLTESGPEEPLSDTPPQPPPSTVAASASSSSSSLLSSSGSSGAAGQQRQTPLQGRQQTTGGANNGIVSSRGSLEEDRMLDPYQLNLITGCSVVSSYLPVVVTLSGFAALLTVWPRRAL